MTNDVRPPDDVSRTRIEANNGPAQAIPITDDVIVHSSWWAQAAGIYIGAKVLDGMIGNAAYDAVKAALGRLLRRGVPADPGTPNADVVLVARTAVNARSETLGGDELVDADANVACWPTSDGVEVLFRGQPRGVVASVQLSIDEQRGDVRATVRLAEKPVSRRRDVEDDGVGVGVLGAADGWELLPPA
jgi:hypothetical protein